MSLLWKKFLLWTGILVFCFINFLAFAIISSTETNTDVCDERLVPLSLFALAFNIVQVLAFCEIKKEKCSILFLRFFLVIPSGLFVVFFWQSFYKCFGQIKPKSLEVIFVIETLLAHINLIIVLFYYSKKGPQIVSQWSRPNETTEPQSPSYTILSEST